MSWSYEINHPLAASIDAIEGWSSAGKPSARGRNWSIESEVLTSGRPVVGDAAKDGPTFPGSEASEKDQPPPTALSGMPSASAIFTPVATSSTVVGNNIRLATYPCVFGQFCHQWL